jgi:26S proteasome regulatory subunit N7
MFEKARFYSRIGSWQDATAAFDDILKLEKLSTGKRIDATLDKARIALFLNDVRQLRELISLAKKLVEQGGDWDRRNRLKVYEALYLLSIRDIKPASTLFMDCIATFTCVELCSYNKFMFYAILTGILSLNRTELKTKIISNPQVISVIRELPKAASLLNSLYSCDYAGFIRALLDVSVEINEDRYMGPHATYVVREYRVLGYSQFLEAYKSVMLSSMAKSFGISITLLDEELSRFIAAGRLCAKIDKVGDVIETSRPDKKNAQYQDVIKKGDALLNQIQKLVRAIDV